MNKTQRKIRMARDKQRKRQEERVAAMGTMPRKKLNGDFTAALEATYADKAKA